MPASRRVLISLPADLEHHIRRTMAEEQSRAPFATYLVRLIELGVAARDDLLLDELDAILGRDDEQT